MWRVTPQTVALGDRCVPVAVGQQLLGLVAFQTERIRFALEQMRFGAGVRIVAGRTLAVLDRCVLVREVGHHVVAGLAQLADTVGLEQVRRVGAVGIVAGRAAHAVDYRVQRCVAVAGMTVAAQAGLGGFELPALGQRRLALARLVGRGMAVGAVVAGECGVHGLLLAKRRMALGAGRGVEGLALGPGGVARRGQAQRPQHGGQARACASGGERGWGQHQGRAGTAKLVSRRFANQNGPLLSVMQTQTLRILELRPLVRPRWTMRAAADMRSARLG